MKDIRQLQKHQATNTLAGIIDINNPITFKKVRNQLQKAVKGTKQGYYKKMLEELDHKNIFQAVKWLSSIRQYTTPSIQQQDGNLAVNNPAKQKALKEALITPPPLNSDYPAIQLDLSQETRTDPIFSHPCVEKEVEAGILHVGNTAAGVDKTPPLINKKSLPVYQEEIIQLFQFCLDEGYHPKIFKTAILFALPKPGKRARVLSRFYRLIALLSCLEKALEQIVANR